MKLKENDKNGVAIMYITKPYKIRKQDVDFPEYSDVLFYFVYTKLRNSGDTS